MNNIYRVLIIYASIFIGATLLIGGLTFFLSNIFNPQGFLFESIMSIAGGITLLMIVLIASTIGDTIMLYDAILRQTTRLYEELIKQTKEKPRQKPLNLPDNIIITNMNTGEESTIPIDMSKMDDSMKKINDEMLNYLMNAGKKKNTLKPVIRKNKELKDMNLKELEKELSTAVKKDDYEKASEINGYIHLIKNPPASDENNDDIL